jgi:hypothetical protein
MGVLPDSDGWTLLQSGGTAGVSSGILNILTGSTDQLLYSIEVGTVDASKLKRMQSILRVNTSPGEAGKEGQYFGIRDGVRSFLVILETGQLTMFNNTTSPLLLFTGDMTSYRDVLIEMDNISGAKLFIDGNLESTTAYASIWASGTNDIRFGDPVPAADEFTGDVDYDNVNYQLDVAANPDTGTGGQTLFVNSDVRYKVVANKDLEQDFIILEEQTNDDVTEATVVKSISMVNDDDEVYTALTEDTDVKYANGSNFVRRFELLSTIAGGSNIFVKTTVTKNLASDVHTIIDEYGQVVKVGV